MVPPPVFATLSVWAAGAAPPAVAVNVRPAGVTDSAGGRTGSTVNVTGMVLGDPAAPGAVTVMSVVYVPVGRPAMFGVTVIVPLPVPPAGERLSHEALSLALQFSVPPPELLTPSVLAAGLTAPTVPRNERLVGLTESAGGVGAVFLNTTVAIDHGVLAPVETRAAGVSPVPAVASSATNSMSLVGETLTRSL